jgi:hypothetical protein
MPSSAGASSGWKPDPPATSSAASERASRSDSIALVTARHAEIRRLRQRAMLPTVRLDVGSSLVGAALLLALAVAHYLA